jgi:uncharacterized cupredoxin-like copper-binding protein
VEASQVLDRRTRGRVVSCLLIELIVGAVVWVAPPAFGSASTPRHRLEVTIRDFKVTVSRHTVESGRVVIHVTNRGPSTHEINLDRTDLAPGSLPLKTDGLTVDETNQDLHRIDSIEELNLGDSGDLTVRLKPGRYVLYCNLEGHYLGGMHASFDVVSELR